MKSAQNRIWSLIAALAMVLGLVVSAPAQNAVKLLNVSYDPTRELYQAFNTAFAKYWQTKAGQAVTLTQARYVLERGGND